MTILAVFGFAGCIGSCVLLVVVARRMVRAHAAAEVLRGPVVPIQKLQFPSAGELRLCLDGPKGAAWRVSFRAALRDEATGNAVALVPMLAGGGMRSPTRSRVARQRLVLPAPGTYVLQIDEVEPTGRLDDWFVVFMRPYAVTLVLHILAIVLAAMLAAGGLVLGILAVV